MKKLAYLLFCAAFSTASAQTALELKQQSLSKWNVGTAQYSGIASMGGNRYAVVSDKEPQDGFFVFQIDQNDETGEVEAVRLERFSGNKNAKVDAHGISIRDCEGIAYFPPAHTLFISGEGDQKILEYAMDGQPTGRELLVPDEFALNRIVPNYGFEALCYDSLHHRFWTTTESMLPADGRCAGQYAPLARNLLRLQSFDDNMHPEKQYAYRMESGRSSQFGKLYAYGVPAITALPDGRLLVLEREANVTSKGLRSEVLCRLFVIDTGGVEAINSRTNLQTLEDDRFVPKKLLAEWRTGVQPFRVDFANYEGMCLGRTLRDGRRTLLLVNDSQGGYHKGPYRLKDYIKVILIGD